MTFDIRSTVRMDDLMQDTIQGIEMGACAAPHSLGQRNAFGRPGRPDGQTSSFGQRLGHTNFLPVGLARRRTLKNVTLSSRFRPKPDPNSTQRLTGSHSLAGKIPTSDLDATKSQFWYTRQCLLPLNYAQFRYQPTGPFVHLSLYSSLHASPSVSLCSRLVVR